MRRRIPEKIIGSEHYEKSVLPVKQILFQMPALNSRGNRPLKMTFEDQLNALIFFHLYEHDSARHLIQELNGDDFAEMFISPEGGISRSSFSETINHRGSEQLQHVFRQLSIQAESVLPEEYDQFGDLMLPDGSPVDAVLSMHRADYRKGSEKAEAHFCSDLNYGVPSEISLTDGNGAERPFVEKYLSPGQTGVMDRGYQCHKQSDRLQRQGKSFVCRIKQNTTLTVINENHADPDSYVFYDAIVLLGTPGISRSEIPLRVIPYRIGRKICSVATDRHDLTAEQIAEIYKLRRNIGTFFKWWKQHLKVCHLIARSRYGLMVQILGGLITYLLMAIYCHSEYNEKVSLNRFRKLRIDIQNDLRQNNNQSSLVREQSKNLLYAKT
jgi:hypothetical protein